MAHVLAEPRDLLGAERAKAARLEIEHVHEPDEMHAGVVEAVPAAALRALTVALQIRHSVVGRDIVLAGHVENAIRLETLEHFVRCIELARLRELRDVAGVQNERGALRQRVHLVHCFLQSGGDILVRFLAEADVTVAHLHEEDALALRIAQERQPAHGKRAWNATSHSPDGGRSRPRHAAEKAAPIDAVLACLARDEISALWSSISFMSNRSARGLRGESSRQSPGVRSGERASLNQ